MKWDVLWVLPLSIYLSLFPLLIYYFISFRVNGYEDKSLATHGLLAGIINFGFNLGASAGPLIGGAVKEMWGFQANTAIAACLFLAMVSWKRSPIHTVARDCQFLSQNYILV